MLIITQLVTSITSAMNCTAHPLKMNAENYLKVDNLTTAIKNSNVLTGPPPPSPPKKNQQKNKTKQNKKTPNKQTKKKSPYGS